MEAIRKVVPEDEIEILEGDNETVGFFETYLYRETAAEMIPGDEVMAASLIDRVPHHCHVVNIRGNSYRMRYHAELYKALNVSGAESTEETMTAAM